MAKEASKPAGKKTSYESQESLYRKAVEKMNADSLIVQAAFRMKNDELAAKMFEEVGDYLDAPQLAKKCRKLAAEAKAEEKKAAYDAAVFREKDAKTEDEWKHVQKAFEAIGDYEDATERAQKASQHLEKFRKKAKRTRFRFLAGVLLIAVIGIGLVTSGMFRYVQGYVFMKAGRYSAAQKLFEASQGFLNSDRYAEYCMLRPLMTSGLGKDVAYGTYQWKILSRDGEEVTLIAASIGESHPFYTVPFNETSEDVTWEESTLRIWLNTDALQNCFGERERAHLMLQESSAVRNDEYGTEYVQHTQDYLTLLSTDEAEQEGTKKFLNDLGGNYWLRTPGYGMNRAAYIDSEHVIRKTGAPVNDANMMVRPVITVNCSLDYQVSEEDFPQAVDNSLEGIDEKYAPLLTSAIGKDVSFGRFKWKILARENGVVTMIASDISSKHPFSQVSFHDSEGEVTWKESDLRKWLNGEVLDYAFSASERSMLKLQISDGSANAIYGTAYHEHTEDYLTILSVEDTQNPAYKNLLEDLGHSWWLRTPGESLEMAAFMDDEHHVRQFGTMASKEKMAVRPIIVVDCHAAENAENIETETEITVSKKYQPLLDTEIGSNVVFGKYQWKILRRENGVVTMIAAEISEDHPFRKVPFDAEGDDASWGECSLRQWLNTEALESFFDDEDRSLLVLQHSEGSENAEFGTSDPEATDDYLTIMSAEDTQSIWYASLLKDLGLNWWLRTPGKNEGRAAYMDENHVVQYGGAATDNREMSVRPVIVVDCKLAKN